MMVRLRRKKGTLNKVRTHGPLSPPRVNNSQYSIYKISCKWTKLFNYINSILAVI